MSEEHVQKKKKRKWLIPVVILVIVITGTIWFFCDYYHAQDTAKSLLQGSDTVLVKNMEDGLFLDGPGDGDAIIFYPGAKVEFFAYLPVFFDVAEQGIDVFLVEMPVNFALFGINKADEIREEYDYENWYMAGHSLGGAMAAKYVSKHLDEYKGIIFLAAYTTESLKQDSFRVLSIYGSEDKVLRMNSFEKGRDLVPADYIEICIEGGNHGQFGDYGIQSKDGKALISKEEQWEITCKEIIEFVKNR